MAKYVLTVEVDTSRSLTKLEVQSLEDEVHNTFSRFKEWGWLGFKEVVGGVFVSAAELPEKE